VVEVPHTRDLGLDKSETLILSAIRICNVEVTNDLDMHYYRRHGRVEVVDITSIQCLVGRIHDVDDKWWAIIDRSGKLACPKFDID